MYAGLTTADNGALLDAKARGAEWVARDEATTLWGYDSKPHKFVYGRKYATWTIDNNNFLLGAIDLNDDLLSFIQWSDPDPVNIDLAIAQIAEMERMEKSIRSDRYYEILEEIKGWKPWQKEAFNQLATSEHATQLDIEQKPQTWNERINQMTVEEKATLFQHDDCFIYKLTGTAYCDRHLGCEECTKQFLDSPDTEGATK